MMLKKMVGAIAISLAALAGGNALADTVTKAPDIGTWWHPLGSSGTPVYSNSFVASITGVVTEFGLWLKGGPADLRFQIYDSIGGNLANGPDSSSALVTSGVITGQTFANLTYVSAAPLSGGATLQSGHTYWFAATGVGLASQGSYYVGGHTQNSGGIVDNGTFWFSNDVGGITFDGRGYTPEMAFQVTLAPVPEPESFALLIAGLGLMGAVARRRTRS